VISDLPVATLLALLADFKADSSEARSRHPRRGGRRRGWGGRRVRSAGRNGRNSANRRACGSSSPSDTWDSAILALKLWALGTWSSVS